MRLAFVLEGERHGDLRSGKSDDTAGRDGVKRYAFTSLWCAYAAVASVIILAYFWKSSGIRPFKYVL
jgi:hypothetical protein